MSRDREITRPSISSAEDFPVRIFRAQESAQASGESEAVFGFTLQPSSRACVRASSSSKTSRAVFRGGCRTFGTSCTCSATVRAPSRFLPPRSAPGICADESSLWPTLTAKANLLAPSMQKWAAHRRLLPTLTAQSYGTNRGGSAGRSGPVRPSLNTLAGGSLSPTWCEWFMGFPEGWTDVDGRRSETPSFRNVQK